MTAGRLRIFMHTGVLTLLVGLTLGLAVPRWSEARATGGFGVMGDSSSDEYRADDNRGGAYAATTLNWVELLARYRGLDFGAWATRAEPRRTGYEYNWARSGARAADLIAQGQAAGLAQQVAEGRVSSVVVMIGANDFSLTNNTYAEIYSGAVTGAALTAKIDGIVASIASALDIVRSAGPVQLLVVNLPALDGGAALQASFPDPARRRLVTNAILAVNAGIANITAQRGIVVVDIDAFAIAAFSGADANGNVTIGGELVNLLRGGDEPHHALLGDNYHGGTVSEGMLANYFLDHFAAAGGPIIPRFTDQDLLANAGIVPTDITPPTVSIGAPAGGATVSGTLTIRASSSDNVGVAGVRFKVDGNDLGAERIAAPYSGSWDTTTATNGPHVLTAIARDAAGNTATATLTVHVLNPLNFYPSSYVVVHGSHQSGSLESLRAADGNHLVVSSTTSGVERTTYVEFTISGVVGSVPRLDFKAILKSSASSTTARIYAYDVAARAWTQLNAFLVGTTEVTRNISVSTKARRYVDAAGTVRVRMQSAQRFPAYALSVELLRVTIPP